jgi:hypothetical protein
MACSLTLAGRGVGCKDALGGIKRIYVSEWTDGFWDDEASGEVADATAAETFYTYDMTRGSGSLNQTITSDLAAGTVYFDQVCSVTFNKVAAADIAEISNLVKGRMAVLVQDNNDNWFVMGHKNGVEVTGGTAQTGTAAGDQNGFTIEFSAQEVAPAPFLALTAGAPSGVNITITAAP